MIIHKDSHTDHAISEDQWRHILATFEERTGFFIETIELPEDLGHVMNGLYGPTCGDGVIPESEVYYAPRPPRTWNSRMTKMPARPTRFVRVIAGPHQENCGGCDGSGTIPYEDIHHEWKDAKCPECTGTGKGMKYDCILYTAYGVASKDMPAAPKEPGDLIAQFNAIPNGTPENDDRRAKLHDDIEKAQFYWDTHALATEVTS